MIYCDIHTHQIPLHPEDITIVNRIVGEPEENPSVSLQSIGIHPWYIGNTGEQLKILEKAVKDTKIVAVGEAGMDKFAESPMDIQMEVFKAQAILAGQAAKPLIIHCVKAWDELIAAKKQINPHMPWIIHGFRGKQTLAKQLLHQGFYLSFGKHFNPEAMQEAWPGRIFAETDDSDTDIRTIYNQFSSSLNISLETISGQIRENVQKVFSV